MSNVDNLESAVYKSCELLLVEKNLITIKNIKAKLKALGYDSNKLNDMDYDLVSIINKWRITKLDKSDISNAQNIGNDFNIYQALSIPKKEDKNLLSSMQKKILHLEYEINKYKHTICRSNQKIKLLEKKLHTTISNVRKERQELILGLKNLLSTQVM